MGEMTCSDGCMAKDLEGEQIIGIVLQNADEEQVQQQQVAALMVQKFIK